MGIVMNAAARRRVRAEPLERVHARREYRDHICRPGDVRSYQFRRASGGTNHWFGLTWTPGHLALVGDIGELVLTHYSALSEFERGIRWAATGSYDYLMEKSDKVHDKELDRRATAEFIIESANQNAAWYRADQVKERRRYRRALIGAFADWEADLAAWHFGRSGTVDDEADRPLLADYLPNHYREDEAYTCRFRKKHEPDRRLRLFVGDRSERERWDIPDGWSDWFDLWAELRHSAAFDFSDEDDANVVLTSAGRRALREALVDRLDDDMHDGDVADLCRELGFDDYYGTYRYKPRTIWQIEAIQHGCNMILDQVEPKRTWGRTWGDPVV